jgi:integrase
MTRLSFQQGYVSNPLPTRRGPVFKIRYRIRRADGKWKHKSETLYGLAGKKAAKAILAQRIQEASAQKSNVAELTFREFVETHWKAYLDRKQIKLSTRSGYQSALDRHLLPALGGIRLAEIAPLHLEELLSAKTKSGASPKTVCNLVGLLQGIFSLAVDNDLIPRSPVRVSHKPVLKRKERPVWTAEQVHAIVTETPEHLRALIICVALIGVRLGELLGLKWKHVDFEMRMLQIQQSLWKGQLVTPKTDGSIRTIRFGEVLARVLTDHMQTSQHIGPEDFVFCKPDGSPYHPDVLRKDVLYPALDRLRIPRISRMSGFHAFRHSAGSIVNAQTGNLKLAQKLLGHSNLSTTADIYTHVYTESEREAALAVEQAIFGTVPSCSQFREQEQTHE